jgi:two-component system OmpR family response regulator
MAMKPGKWPPRVPYDALVLDIMVPGRDGLSILRGLREKRNTVPVILLTARTTLPEKIEGLNLGADDYMTKPFFVEELAARLRTVVRRKAGDASHLLRVEDLCMDLLERKVSARQRGHRAEHTRVRAAGAPDAQPRPRVWSHADL